MILKCTICDWVYDEKLGAPDHGIEPETEWEDIPEDWECPKCGAGKGAFNKAEETNGE